MNTNNGGVGLAGLLGILFIGLKLAHAIAWPWIWVLAPFWVGIALWLAGALVVVIFAFISTVVGRGRRNRALRKRVQHSFYAKYGR